MISGSISFLDQSLLDFCDWNNVCIFTLRCLRAPGYIALDMGLYKSFKMPWEGHSLQFRWEVFNVTNTQRFDGLTIADLGLGRDPFLGSSNPSQEFGRFTSTQTPLNETKAGRVMQFALRYTF